LHCLNILKNHLSIFEKLKMTKLTIRCTGNTPKILPSLVKCDIVKDDIVKDDIVNETYEEDENENDEYIFVGTGSNPEFTANHILTRSSDKSIREDLEKLGLPIDIINEADGIFQQMRTGTRRGQKRKQMIFHCARAAYDKLKIPRDPKLIADLCGIPYSGITKAASMCSPVQTQYTSPVVVYRPIDFIKSSFDRLSQVIESYIQLPDDTLENMLCMAADVQTADKRLLEEKPQMVAAAIILYYLETHGIKIDRKKYASLFNSSDMTIAKLKKQVEAAYNA
jgi:transcription initiation factor TFIIIB Brf1 subunit/transcription initiation factor TFIIB